MYATVDCNMKTLLNPSCICDLKKVPCELVVTGQRLKQRVCGRTQSHLNDSCMFLS